MSTTLHRTVIITGFYEVVDVVGVGGTEWREIRYTNTLVDKVDKVRAQMPANIQELLVGPFDAGANGYYQYFFVTSGSSHGWPSNFEHEWYCHLLLEAFGHEAILVTDKEGEPPTVEVGKYKKSDQPTGESTNE